MYENDLIIDFETRSRCDLKAAGAYNYALDPSTEILCLGAIEAAADDNTSWLWYPHDGPLPDSLRKRIAECDRLIAHNANFDQLIYETVGVPDHDYPVRAANKWLCSSATARVNAMPAGLDDLTRALNSKHRKDHKGSALIRKLSIPNADGEFNEDPKALKDMGAYCIDDVKATKSALLALRPMTDEEHEDWLVNERINDRGVKIDIDLATFATQYADEEQQEIAVELTELTDGAITKHTQNQRISKWVSERLTDDTALQLMTVYKFNKKVGKNEKKLSLAKDIREEILGRSASGEIEVPYEVIEVIKALDAGSKSSVAKFKRMLSRADPETERAHGAFVYAGASQTLRAASRGLQLHNMRRDCFKPGETERLKKRMGLNKSLLNPEGEILPVMETLSKLLRPTLVPDEGKVYVVGDWSAIEARALPWLANSRGAEKKLDAFRRGEDTYVNAAKAIGLADPAGDGRQVGKVSELSLGYGGAKGAFAAMAKNYGVFLPEYRVEEIVSAWRDTNVWAVRFWNQLHEAAISAVQNPGVIFKAGRAEYLFMDDLIDGTLICMLPGDLIIQYPKAKVELLETQWGLKPTLTAMKANYKPAADATEWPRIALWRGLLAENITQAFCGRLLRHILRKFNDIIAHVHDEVVREVYIELAEEAVANLRAIMEEPPEWAKGFPLKAEPTIMTRYGK